MLNIFIVERLLKFELLYQEGQIIKLNSTFQENSCVFCNQVTVENTTEK